MSTPSPEESPITRLLRQAEGGEEEARSQLFRVLYSDLRGVARARLHQLPIQSLDASDLVNEMYLRLFRKDQLDCKNRKHFFFVCGRAMQDILVEHVRRKISPKHGGGLQRVVIDQALTVADRSPEEFLAVSGAISRLSEEDPETADIVRLRYFVGLTGDEIARVVGLAPVTVDRRIKFAHAWLHEDISGQMQ
ncbi:MAG: sigma-70 family RNA polymerase sigma factor [Candidatus Eisenbacteria bacterium]|nr:sigma-70 family RNA polymerase sigma factor [Candidatus Eisenbacteria bacterium]